MLSICEITKVAPCGFLATSPWVPCAQVSQHPTALWWGREVGARRDGAPALSSPEGIGGIGHGEEGSAGPRVMGH